MPPGELNADVAMVPQNAERVEDNRISDRQFIGRNHKFVGVADDWIKCLTPALVVDDTVKAFTSCLGVVPRCCDTGLLRRETFTNLLGLEASRVAQFASSTRKINQSGQLTCLELGRLLSRQEELYDLSAVQHRGALQRFPEVLG